MKTQSIQLSVVALCLSFFCCDIASSEVHVRGYTRRDGTYVAPYTRKSPPAAANSLPSYVPNSSSNYKPSYAPNKLIPTPTGLTRNHVIFIPVFGSIISSRHYYSSGYVGSRDKDGRIVRSEAAKRAFMKMSGYPHGRPGYVVDHIIALKRGGADDPSNMQWQTIEEAKAKDKWE